MGRFLLGLVLSAWFWAPAIIFEKWRVKGCLVYLLVLIAVLACFPLSQYLEKGFIDDELMAYYLIFAVPAGGVLNLIVFLLVSTSDEPDRSQQRRAGDGQASGAGLRVPFEEDQTQAMSYQAGAGLGELYVDLRCWLKKRRASARGDRPDAATMPAPGQTRAPSQPDPRPGCPTCGAWNPPDAEHCGECCAALAGSEARVTPT
jgi:hypothetical protein